MGHNEDNVVLGVYGLMFNLPEGAGDLVSRL